MRHLLLALLLLPASPAALPAQWRVALLTGTAASHGDARDETDPTRPEIHADALATLAVSLARNRGPWRIGVDLHHTSADLAEISGSTALTTRNALSAWGAALELGHRLAGRAGGPNLRVSLAAGVDRWRFELDESSPRWRASARGAWELEAPITTRWAAVVRGQASVGPSVFRREELPEGFVQRTAVRLGMVFGVARQW